MKLIAGKGYSVPVHSPPSQQFPSCSPLCIGHIDFSSFTCRDEDDSPNNPLPLLTIWTAYSPRTIFLKAAQFTFFLLLLTEWLKASAGGRPRLIFQKRCRTQRTFGTINAVSHNNE